MVREIGPVLTGLMVAGRSATGMASELGSMQVTEQIDAMRALGTDPSKKLVTPRVVSTIIMLVVLTVIADLVSMVGGSLVAVFMLRLDGNQYWSTAWQSLALWRHRHGTDQALRLRLHHLHHRLLLRHDARGGTQGVGRATTQAMVAASVRWSSPICSSRNCCSTSSRIYRPKLMDGLPATQEPVIIFEDVSIAFDDNKVLDRAVLYPVARADQGAVRRGRHRQDPGAETGHGTDQAGQRAHHAYWARR